MSTFRPALFLLMSLLAAPAWAQKVDLRAPGDIAEFLAPYLPAEPLTDPQARDQARLGLARRIPPLLATEGYFSPRLEFSETGASLRLDLDPGPRTTVVASDIVIDGDLPPARRAALLADWALPVGKPFRQADWSDAKEALLDRLLAEDHAAARLIDSRAEIDPQTAEARLHARYAAGPAYRFGPLDIEGLARYTPDLVQRFNFAVRPGDPYRRDRLNALQSALQGTPYFSSVEVAANPAEAIPGEDGLRVPVQVQLRERQPHRLGLGGGVSSNTGARVEANYHTADLFRRAWELNSVIRFEQKRQAAWADVFLPPDAQHYRHSFGALSEHTDISGLATERYALGVQRLQQRGAIEMRLGLNWQTERRRPEGAEASTSRALVALGNWTWRRIDSLLDPRDGIVLQGQIGGAAKALLSDRDFVRLYGRYQQFFPLGRSNVLALRGELGHTFAESRQGIPQDYLFRAGGTNSVRGYSYQSLGVREGAATVGGRYLATASAEVTHWLDERWGIAAFIDTGNASDTPGRLQPKTGYGLGARWKSPAGPIAIDLAYGRDSRKLQLHFSLAIPL